MSLIRDTVDPRDKYQPFRREDDEKTAPLQREEPITLIEALELIRPGEHCADLESSDATTADLGLEKKRVARYELASVLSKSQRATVYRAFDPNVDRQVVLKVMDTEAIDDASMSRDDWIVLFEREARIAGKAKDPRIPVLFDAGRDGSNYFMAMELLHGEVLRTLLVHSFPMSAASITRVIRDVASALLSLHDEGIMHGDVRPGNIVVTDAFSGAYLLDFSLAFSLGESPNPQLRMNLPYVAPEYLSRGEYTPKSEQFALGAVLYQMLVGEHPFRSSDLSALENMVLHEEPIAPDERRSDCDPLLSKIAMRLLEKNPEARFADLKELLHMLDEDHTPTPIQPFIEDPTLKRNKLPNREGRAALLSEIYENVRLLETGLDGADPQSLIGQAVARGLDLSEERQMIVSTCLALLGVLERPFEAQVVAVVDAYCQATRPQRQELRVSPRRALLELRNRADRGEIRADVVEALAQYLREVLSALELPPRRNGSKDGR